MGWLNDILDFFRAILDFIKENFVILLAIAVIVLAVFFPGALAMAWGWLVEVGMPTLGAWGGAVAGFFADLGLMGTIAAVAGLGFLIDPEGTSEAIGGIIDSVGGAAGNVGGSIVSAIVSSPIAWVVGGAAALWWLTRDDGESQTSGGDVYINDDRYSGRY